jgi:hypothetical protein
MTVLAYGSFFRDVTGFNNHGSQNKEYLYFMQDQYKKIFREKTKGTINRKVKVGKKIVLLSVVNTKIF